MVRFEERAQKGYERLRDELKDAKSQARRDQAQLFRNTDQCLAKKPRSQQKETATERIVPVQWRTRVRRLKDLEPTVMRRLHRDQERVMSLTIKRDVRQARRGQVGRVQSRQKRMPHRGHACPRGRMSYQYQILPPSHMTLRCTLHWLSFKQVS